MLPLVHLAFRLGFNVVRVRISQELEASGSTGAIGEMVLMPGS